MNKEQWRTTVSTVFKHVFVRWQSLTVQKTDRGEGSDTAEDCKPVSCWPWSSRYLMTLRLPLLAALWRGVYPRPFCLFTLQPAHTETTLGISNLPLTSWFDKSNTHTHTFAFDLAWRIERVIPPTLSLSFTQFLPICCSLFLSRVSLRLDITSVVD